uniref:Uncharacterized protein n=1 Tax=Anguilla anguilla TaxID=7936 RepID=A0A0E9T489_ANGAN
MDCNQLNHILS